MKTIRNIIMVVLLIVVSPFTSCLESGGSDDNLVPLEASKAALTTTGNIKANLEAVSAILKFIEDFELFQKGFKVASGDMVCSVPITYDPGTGEPTGEGEEECEYEPSEEELEVNLEDAAQSIVDTLNQYIFVDSQIEEDSGTYVIYLLDPAVFCAMFEKDGEDEEVELEASDAVAECQEFLTDVPVRLKFYSKDEGDIDVDILIGTAQHKALNFEFHETQLAVDVDLAEYKAAMDVALDAVGDDDLDELVMENLHGVVRLQLDLPNENSAVAQVQVVEAISGHVEADGRTLDFDIGTGTLQLLADKAEQTISVVVNLGATNISFPYQSFIDSWYDSEDSEDDAKPQPVDDITEGDQPPTVSGTMELALAGVNIEAVFDAKDESLKVPVFGMGTGWSGLKLNGDTVIGMQMNPDNGAQASVVVTMSEDGNVVIMVKPLLDVSIAWAMNLIASDVGEDLPQMMLDETWNIRLDGAAEPKVEVLEGEPDQWLKVLTGTLTLTSTATAAQTFTAAANQCVWFANDEDTPEPINADDISSEDEPNLITMMEAGQCVE